MILQIKTWFLALPTKYKVLVLIGILFLCALIFRASVGIKDHFENARLQKIIKKHEKTIADSQTEKLKLEAADNALRQELANLKGQATIKKQDVDKASADVEAKKQEIENEDKRYQDEVAHINSDDVDPCERVRRTCERAKSLGLLDPDKSCSCTAGDSQ